MLPITEINIGDQFENPMLRPDGLTFVIMKINKPERMIQVQGFNSKKLENIGSPLWKKNTDRMFSESWRVFNMKQFRKENKHEINL